MDVPELELITYQDFIKLSFPLARKIAQHTQDQPIELIISINRGGSVLARILSDFLDVPVASFGLVSYQGINNQKELRIYQDLNADLKGKRVLLVDDLSDTGRTFIKALDVAQKLEPAQVLTAALISKPHAIFTPDFFSTKTDKWVVFPYEVRETLTSLGSLYKTNRSLKARLSKYFMSLGVSASELKKIETSLL